MLRWVSCTALLACLSWGRALSAEEVPNLPRPSVGHFEPVAGTTPLGPADLVPPLLDDEAYNDKFTFDIFLDGDIKLYYSVFITNLGPGQGKARVRSSVTLPDGTSYDDDHTLDDDEWNSRGDSFDMTLRGYHLRGTPDRLQLSVTAKAYAFDLVAEADVPPWRPPQGTIEMRKAPLYFHTVYVAPRNRVTGTLSLSGGAPREVKGFGYGIHSHSNAAPYQLAWRWVSLRSVAPDWTLFTKQLVTSADDGKRAFAWLLIAGPDGVKFESSDVDYALTETTPDEKHVNHYPVPGKVVIHARHGSDEAWILLRAGTLRSRSEPLKSMNALVRAVAEAVTKPLEIEYLSPFVVRLRVSGKWYAFDGTGHYELSFLNQ
jgi:hypothetical protein